MDAYEVFERFCIIAENEGDSVALRKIKSLYGLRAVRWITKRLYGEEVKTC